MINKMQIWHHNNPKHYGEKKKSVTLFCWLFQFSGPMFFSLKSLAINKAFLSSIKEIQVFRAVNVQQKYTPHIYLLFWHYACKHVSQMHETASQHLHRVPMQFISAWLKINQKEAQGEVTFFLAYSLETSKCRGISAFEQRNTNPWQFIYPSQGMKASKYAMYISC